MKSIHWQRPGDLNRLNGMAWLEDLNDAIEKLCAYRCSLIEEHERLSNQILKMQEHPHYENARIWFRDEQYAYLHRSFPGGQRSRTYIGTNTQKLAAVEEAIALGKRITLLKAQVEDIEKQATHQARRVLPYGYGDRHA